MFFHVEQHLRLPPPDLDLSIDFDLDGGTGEEGPTRGGSVGGGHVGRSFAAGALQEGEGLRGRGRGEEQQEEEGS